VTRADGNPVLLRGSGNEYDLVEFLTAKGPRFQDPWSVKRYALAQRIINEWVQDKRVLVVPAYSASAFIFKKLGAKEVVGVDADSVTVAWLKAIAAGFNFEKIGDICLSLSAYPECTTACRVIPGGAYEHDLISRTQVSVNKARPTDCLDGINFKQSFLGDSAGDFIRSVDAKRQGFDFIYVPYLLGIYKGIEDREVIARAYEQLWQVAKPGAGIMLVPFSEPDEGSCGEVDRLFGSQKSPGLIRKLVEIMPTDKFRSVQSVNFGLPTVAVFEVIK